MTPPSASPTVNGRSAAPDVLELATQLTLSHDLVEVSEMVAEFARQYLGADRVSVAILHSDVTGNQALEVVATSGSRMAMTRGMQVPLEDLVVREAIETAAPVLYKVHDRTELDAVSLAQAGMNEALVTPVLSGDRIMGSLNVAVVDTEIDANAAMQLARLLGSQLDRVVSRSRLERQLANHQLESRRWGLLRGLEQWSVNAVTIDEVVAKVATIVGELIDDPHLAYIEMRTGSAVIHPAHGERHEITIDLEHPRNAGLLERFGSENACYIVDLENDTVEVFAPELLVEGARSVLCVSVDGRGDPLGALVVSSTEVDGIPVRDREMLDAIAPLVGGALERIEIDERLARAATHDQLTGLIRRAVFDEIANEEVTSLRGSDRTSAMVAIDVDRFKVVNDTEGHLAGDDFLLELVARLGRVLEPQDVATRVGADEFAILLRGRIEDEYEKTCGRLVTSVNQSPFIIGGRSLVGTISLGFTLIDADTESARESIAMADAACYAAKMVGGNRVKPALAHDSRQSARRTASQSLVQLRRAIEDDSLTLLGQPIYELASRELGGFEVLVRMLGPDGELIPPGQFLPIAERFHSTEDLDAWVVQRALKRLNGCGNIDGLPPRLFINLSPSSITSPGFVERIESLVSQSAVPADRLCFEITETGTMKSFEEAVRFVERMNALGALVALDDFGVGLSSLSHLHRLPVDVLKIDGSLVRGIEGSMVNSTMVATIQALAASLGKITIAEFVENAAAAEALQEVGVDCGQGFHLGRPKPLCEQLTRAGFGLADATANADQTEPVNQTEPANQTDPANQTEHSTA